METLWLVSNSILLHFVIRSVRSVYSLRYPYELPPPTKASRILANRDCCNGVDGGSLEDLTKYQVVDHTPEDGLKGGPEASFASRSPLLRTCLYSNAKGGSRDPEH